MYAGIYNWFLSDTFICTLDFHSDMTPETHFKCLMALHRWCMYEYFTTAFGGENDLGHTAKALILHY